MCVFMRVYIRIFSHFQISRARFFGNFSRMLFCMYVCVRLNTIAFKLCFHVSSHLVNMLQVTVATAVFIFVSVKQRVRYLNQFQSFCDYRKSISVFFLTRFNYSIKYFVFSRLSYADNKRICHQNAT